MNKDHNLQLQGGTYHVRLAIPAGVRKAFGGKRILSKSLKTGSLTEAMHRRGRYLDVWRAQIKAAKDGVPLPDGWQQDVAFMVEQIDTQRRDKKRALLGEQVQDLPTPDPEMMAKILAAPHIMEPFRQLMAERHREGLSGLVRLEDELAEALKGAIPKLMGQAFKPSKDEQEELNALASGAASYRKKSPITKASLEAFRAFRLARNVSAANVDTQESRLLKLSAFIVQTGKPLDFDLVSQWLDSLALSGKTQQQYLLAGNAFWKWAMKYDARWREAFKGAASPFERHDVPMPKGKEAKDAKRQHFTLADMCRLHTAAEEGGNAPLADLIQLAYFTGARISELCRLRTEHVITVDGVTSLDIADSKTSAGIRVVPIHPAIDSLVARLVNDSPDGYLVVTGFVSKRGDRTGAIGKAFGALKTSLGFGPLHVFHSIRATTITQLARHDVSYPMICELVGHQTKTVTFDTYSAGFGSRQKLAAMATVPVFTSQN
ncbi:tyrosine-type recombinase/integrase [Pseudomonas syringae]|uniref:Tyr recombinase domain-containing protein n=1 Tax=Pseudomonas syringae TaxID=317 RepID=A0A085VHU5_PSESX|nr:tyrosine-type recombinase/integrase [Pseudomonas syringae]KFE55008.1 hypothetical protein IV02_03025 [Pseudomonas syringae]